MRRVVGLRLFVPSLGDSPGRSWLSTHCIPFAEEVSLEISAAETPPERSSRGSVITSKGGEAQAKPWKQRPPRLGAVGDTVYSPVGSVPGLISQKPVKYPSMPPHPPPDWQELQGPERPGPLPPALRAHWYGSKSGCRTGICPIASLPENRPRVCACEWEWVLQVQFSQFLKIPHLANLLMNTA